MNKSIITQRNFPTVQKKNMSDSFKYLGKESPLFPGEESVIDMNSPFKATIQKPPLGFIEQKNFAKMLHVCQYFADIGSPSAFITTHFTPLRTTKTLSEFLQRKNHLYFESHRNGAVSTISLSPNLIKSINVPHAAIYYHNTKFITTTSYNEEELLPKQTTESPLQNFFHTFNKDRMEANGMMTFILQSPSGFWQFSWFDAIKTLELKKNHTFVDMLKKIQITTGSEPSLGDMLNNQFTSSTTTQVNTPQMKDQ